MQGSPSVNRSQARLSTELNVCPLFLLTLESHQSKQNPHKKHDFRKWYSHSATREFGECQTSQTHTRVICFSRQTFTCFPHHPMPDNAMCMKLCWGDNFKLRKSRWESLFWRSPRTALFGRIFSPSPKSWSSKIESRGGWTEQAFLANEQPIVLGLQTMCRPNLFPQTNSISNMPRKKMGMCFIQEGLWFLPPSLRTNVRHDSGCNKRARDAKLARAETIPNSWMNNGRNP